MSGHEAGDPDENVGSVMTAVVGAVILIMWVGWAVCAYLWPIVSVIVVYPVVICTISMIARGAKRT